MFQRKQRRFRGRQNSRNHLSRGNGGSQTTLRTNSFTNGQTRNNFRASLSPEKSFEKYSALAKEAMSLGDKTLSENYLQHVDHFVRIIEDRNRIRNQNKVNVIEKPLVEDKLSSENSDTKQDQIIKNKE